MMSTFEEAKAAVERYDKEPFNSPWSDETMHEAFKGLSDELTYGEDEPTDRRTLESIFDYSGISFEYIDDFISWFQAQRKYAAYLASAGAEYLDNFDPNWRDRVDEERLTMSSGYSCILGQAFGDYSYGVTKIHEARKESDDRTEGEFARELGFIDNHACYLALDYAWQDELRKRR